MDSGIYPLEVKIFNSPVRNVNTGTTKTAPPTCYFKDTLARYLIFCSRVENS